MKPVRVTEAQAALLFADQLPPRHKGAPKPRVKKPKDQLPENMLEAQIRGLLAVKGWTCTRNHVGTYAPYRVLMSLKEKTMTFEQAMRNILRIGEKGQADWRAERIVRIQGLSAGAQIFFWEAKAPHAKPSPDQKTWIAKQRALGWEVEWFDDFDFGGPHSFIDWYRARFGG
jgi:hypothetical protein